LIIESLHTAVEQVVKCSPRAQEAEEKKIVFDPPRSESVSTQREIVTGRRRQQAVSDIGHGLER
jgi:hypothetical protein